MSKEIDPDNYVPEDSVDEMQVSLRAKKSVLMQGLNYLQEHLGIKVLIMPEK